MIGGSSGFIQVNAKLVLNCGVARDGDCGYFRRDLCGFSRVLLLNYCSLKDPVMVRNVIMEKLFFEGFRDFLA